MSLKLNVQNSEKVAVIQVEGTLDAHYAPEFEKKVEEFLKKESKNLIIDLAKVSHIASAGFGAFMPIKNIQDERGKGLVLACLNANVEKVFKLLGFNNVLKTFSTVDEAKKAL